MRKKKTGNALLAFTAAAMVLAVKVESTDAYFTTYVEAQGSAVVRLGGETYIDEEVDGFEKTVQIENLDGDPVYVRARAFAGDEYELNYSGDSWLSPGAGANDGFYLYNKIVFKGEKTDNLVIKFTEARGKNKTFDVVVVYESIPVQYDEDGNVLQPVVDGKVNTKIDWNKKLDVIESKPLGEIIDTSKQDVLQTPEPGQPSSESDKESSSEQESDIEQDDTGSDNGGGN